MIGQSTPLNRKGSYASNENCISFFENGISLFHHILHLLAEETIIFVDSCIRQGSFHIFL